MGFFGRSKHAAFEEKKPEALKADIRMISGCADTQCSADVSNVDDFKLPDPAGKSGGACTAALLNILYKDETIPEKDYSFVEVLTLMRKNLGEMGFEQIPQLSASKPVDVNTKFDLVPDDFTGKKLAVLVGINYVGSNAELSGCWNDVKNMVKYIKTVHGFQDENMIILMDDGEHIMPTGQNIISALGTIIGMAEPGDSLFFHYSGHGCSIPDQSGDEADGMDECLCPVDCETEGLLRDDDILEYLIKPLPEGVSLVCICDCCHSGSILDLPYNFKADGTMEGMEIDEKYNFKKLLKKLGHPLETLAGIFH